MSPIKAGFLPRGFSIEDVFKKKLHYEITEVSLIPFKLIICFYKLQCLIVWSHQICRMNKDYEIRSDQKIMPTRICGLIPKLTMAYAIWV